MLHYVRDSDLKDGSQNRVPLFDFEEPGARRKRRFSPLTFTFGALFLGALALFACTFPFLITGLSHHECESIATFSATVRMPDRQLTSQLQDTDSEEFSEFAKLFCNSLNEGGFSNSINDCPSSTDSCRVTQLLGGSVLVKLKVRQLKSQGRSGYQDSGSREKAELFLKEALNTAIQAASKAKNQANLFVSESATAESVQFISADEFGQCPSLTLSDTVTIHGGSGRVNLRGDVIKVKCIDGYQFSSNMNVKYLGCTDAGTWNNSVGECYALRDCMDLINAGKYDPDGTNYVYFNGQKELRCTEDGWTIIQERVDGSVEFATKTYAEYVEGFKSNTEFWMGLEQQHAITSSDFYHLEVYLRFTLTRGRTEYNHFTIGDAESRYKLEVGSNDKINPWVRKKREVESDLCTNDTTARWAALTECNLGDGLIDSHNFGGFYTVDSDTSTNCSVGYIRGGWWHVDFPGACLAETNLNGNFADMTWDRLNGITETLMAIKRRKQIGGKGCELFPCQNGGTCLSSGLCECTTSWTGYLCQTSLSGWT